MHRQQQESLHKQNPMGIHVYQLPCMMLRDNKNTNIVSIINITYEAHYPCSGVSSQKE